MDFKGFASKYGAYLAAAVLFIAAACIYCQPVLKGKVIYAGDNMTAVAAVQESINYTKQTGDHSWWTGSMFSGMPNYQIGGGQYKSSKWLAPLESILHRGHSHTIWVFLIYFFCFFVLMRSFGIDKWPAIAGAFALALSSYFIVIIAAGHNGKTSTIALMSVVMGGFHLIFQKKYGIGVILTMVFTAVGFSAHPQMAYYIFMMIGLLWFAELTIHIRSKRMRDFLIATALFVCSVGIGLGTGSANVFANAEYASQTIRGGHSDLNESEGPSDNSLDIQYATQWSYGIDETMSFMIPGVMGGASAVNVGKDSKLYKTLVRNGVDPRSATQFCSAVPLYWGEQPFTAGNVYMGAIVCFLFILGLLIVDGPYKWALLAATLFSTALAWGSNFLPLTELFFKWFPLYGKFRAVSSILIVAEIAMPLLGFMAIRDIMEGRTDKQECRKSIMISAGITAGICVAFALLGKSMFTFTSSFDASFAKNLPEWVYDGIIDERKALLVKDSWRSALFICAAALVMLLFAGGKIKKGWMTAALGILIVADMWPVDKRYFNDDNFVTKKQDSAVFAIQPYEEVLLQDKDPHFRVFNLTGNPFNDSRTSYRLKSIGGYSAAKLRRYQDLIDEHLSQIHLPVIGMLNAKYIITENDEGLAVPQINPYALGNAWFVDSIRIADNAKAESDALMEMDLKHTAVTDRDFASFAKMAGPVPENAKITLTSYSPKALDYVSDSDAPGTAIFSEIYYPFGWKATIDGQPAEHFRADYLLRAMNIPAGHHDIHFEFAPDSIRKGDNLSMVFVLLMYLISFGIIGYSIWRRVGKGSSV